MKRTLLALLALALTACGGATSARTPDETTETWTSGDDEALGIEPPAPASDE
jgi:ABC-type glycerol-3-phosphate transport system substrate-binding protein